MAGIGDIVYAVILWSVLGRTVVNSQCTTTGCGVEYGSSEQKHPAAIYADEDDEFKSEIEELKLQIQLITDELGMLYRILHYLHPV